MQIGKHKNHQAGFTYLTILFAVVIAGVLLARTGINWSQSAQRDKEHELIFIGNQYRQAIAQYYERTPGAIKRYPEKLENLITDARFISPQHYLRKLYRDPMTNQKQWGIIAAPEGGIMGVYSLSDAAAIKLSNFSYADKSFEGKMKYSDLKFSYAPQITVSK